MAGWVDYAFGQNWVEQLKEGYRTTHPEHVRDLLPDRIERHEHHFVDMCVYWADTPQGTETWGYRDEHAECDMDDQTYEPIFELQQ